MEQKKLLSYMLGRVLSGQDTERNRPERIPPTWEAELNDQITKQSSFFQHVRKIKKDEKSNHALSRYFVRIDTVISRELANEHPEQVMNHIMHSLAVKAAARYDKDVWGMQVEDTNRESNFLVKGITQSVSPQEIVELKTDLITDVSSRYSPLTQSLREMRLKQEEALYSHDLQWYVSNEFIERYGYYFYFAPDIVKQVLGYPMTFVNIDNLEMPIILGSLSKGFVSYDNIPVILEIENEESVIHLKFYFKMSGEVLRADAFKVLKLV